MKKENDLLNGIGQRNPFTVPEGYFDQFPKELMDRLPEKQPQPDDAQPITLWQRVKPWVYMAAMFCGLMCSVRVFVGAPKADTPLFTAAETENLSDEYLDSMLDHSLMDDYTLYVYLTEAE